mmetsp:Transcript_86488/g.201258  ORF Transcript_86488/g.201258 Transcript_86488/m.201258 type:complete len:207 (-) Transcript_86488:230-850(-)
MRRPALVTFATLGLCTVMVPRGLLFTPRHWTSSRSHHGRYTVAGSRQVPIGCAGPLGTVSQIARQHLFPARRAAEGEGAAAGVKHSLLVVADPNPYLGTGTKAALKHVVSACNPEHVTALVLPAGGNATVQQTTIRWWFEELGLAEHQYDELVPPPELEPAVAVANAAEDLDSAQVVVAADVVAQKRLGVPLLSTFLGCPLVIVPE